MYLWALEGRQLNQVVRRCFCQGTSLYAQHTVIPLRYSKSVFAKRYTTSSTLLNKYPITPISYVLEKKFYGLTTMSEQSFSSSSENQDTPGVPNLSNKDKLKRAVKDYGATVIIFHVTISLMSLGISYLVISSGVDVASLLSKIGINSANDIATGASTFVVAYAVHKVFAPVRISITLGATPFIVRYLRRVGILKPPKTSGP